MLLAHTHTHVSMLVHTFANGNELVIGGREGGALDEFTVGNK